MTMDAYRDGKVHILSERCSTCVFRPGNLMTLEVGRLKDLVDGNLEADSALVCHQTLPYADKGAEHQAVCRGFYDSYCGDSLPLRMATALDMIVEDEPPA